MKIVPLTRSAHHLVTKVPEVKEVAKIPSKQKKKRTHLIGKNDRQRKGDGRMDFSPLL